MTSGRRSRYLEPDLGRLHIFVPAIMGVGAMFWAGSLVRDLYRNGRRLALDRTSSIAGRGAARVVWPHASEPDPTHSGLRHRNAYLVIAAGLVAFGAYVFIGSYHNYRRDEGYVEHLGWVLALATVATLAALVGAAAAATTWASWPDPPIWVRAVDRSTPLTRPPLDLQDPTSVPSWVLTSAAILVPSSTLVLTLLVARAWMPIEWVDERVAEWIDRLEWAGVFRVLDPLGSWEVALVLVLGVALATLRCRPLAVSYPVAVVLGVIGIVVTRGFVDRAPRDGMATADPDGFPSSHMVFATLLAGLVPLGIAALFRTHRFTSALRLLLGLGVLASAVARIHDRLAWPSDVVVGVLGGVSLLLWVQWAIDHRRWHRLCRQCLWAPQVEGPPLLGIFDFHVSVAAALKTLAHLSAAVAVLTMSVLTLTVGIPTSPDGTGFGLQIQVPVQIALIVVVSVGALVSWKWDAAGALMMAFGGSGLAVFAAGEYRLLYAAGIAVMFAVPAFLLWLSWQHRRSMTEIVTVGVIAVVLVGGSWAGAVAVQDYWYGPTHPDSDEPFVAADRVAWVWLGRLTDREIDVVVGPVGSSSNVSVVARPVTGGPQVRSDVVEMVGQPAARLRLSGLEPGTDYTFEIEVDGRADTARGRGSFTTAPSGAGSFRFAFAACARTGSNGAVFDAIADHDPLFFLNLGDFHYANLESSVAADHRQALIRQLTTPAQAALYREVPIGYVWDDHDYGPNDSDASSPSREAARESYRQMVPHHDLVEGDGGAIYQAFSVGRVRFVLTDSRSERTEETMLGDRQLAWLIDELTAASQTHALVVWGNPVPWIGDAGAGGEHWNAYPEERTRIADALADADVDNLLMISGDAHMLGFDDGTNSDYSTDQVGGFPVVHAAALDRRGSEKGGPYSSPTYPGGGRFALVDVVDDGGAEIVVEIAGQTYDGEVLVDERLTFPVDGP